MKGMYFKPNNTVLKIISEPIQIKYTANDGVHIDIVLEIYSVNLETQQLELWELSKIKYIYDTFEEAEKDLRN